jgi:hypothetical protein
MLDAFIECMEVKNYSRIKRIWFIPVPKNSMIKAWGMIFEEYCILSKNTGYASFFESMKKLYKLNIKITAIENCICVLTKEYSKKCAQILWDFGYRYDFNPNNREIYIMNVNKVFQKSKTLKIEREREQVNFERIKKENNSEVENGTYFEDVIAAISQHQGYRIDPKRTTVKEFCALYSRYEKTIQKKIQK